MKRLNHSLKVNILFALIVVLLLAAAILINGIAIALSDRYPLQIDLTSGSLYEIGADTKALLAGLDTPVELFVLSDEGGFSGTPYLAQAKRILDQYPRYSTNVRLEYVDYAANPTFAVNFPELSLTHGDVIVRSGDNVKHVLVANLFNYNYTADGGLVVSSSRAEEAVTSAIVSVISGESVKIAVLTGNGATEATLFTALLADNNYELSPVALTAELTSDYDAALLFAPTIDLSEDAVRNLESFLYNGGDYGKTLFYTASAAQAKLPNLDAFLAEWGIAFTEGAVFETEPDRTYQYQPFYPTAAYESERYRGMLRDASMPVLMPLSRPMTALFTSKDKYYVETLLTFGETSGARPADAGEDFTADAAEIRGPMPAFVLSAFNATGSGDAPLRSCIAVSASTGIFDAIALQNTSLANAEYLLNLVGDLTDNTSAVNIQSKTLAGKTLGITSGQATTLGVVLVGVLPALILAAGVAAWLFRRYK